MCVCEIESSNFEKVERIKSSLPSEDKILSLTNFYKALGNDTRVKILHSLLVEELCVCDIASVLEMTVSAVSHQLKILKDLKLLKNRRAGKEIFYSLYDSHIEKLLLQTFEHICEE